MAGLDDKDLDPAKDEDHWFCLILLGSLLTLQCQECDRADPQGCLAGTCHKQPCCPSQVVAFQEGCSPLGRSRREQVQRGEDCLPCQESGGPGGGRALGRQCGRL